MKSFLSCISYVFVLLILISKISYGQTEVITPQHKSIMTDNGRFIFMQISEMRRDQYMLDTKLGRLWQVVADSSESISFSPILYRLLSGKYDITPEILNDKSLKYENGRFIFGQISKMRRDQYMLDTYSGRTWQIVADKNDLISLSPVPYYLIKGKYDIIPE